MVALMGNMPHEPERWLTFDIETANDELLAVGYAFQHGNITVGGDVPDELADELADPDVVAVCHSTYDIRWLRTHLNLPVRAQLHDTKVMAWLLDENHSLKLDDLVSRYRNTTMDKRLSGNGKTFRCDDGTLVPFAEAPWDQIVRYNEDDVIQTRALYAELMDRLTEAKLWDYFDVVAAPYTNILLDMEVRGLPIDVDACAELSKRYHEEADRLLGTLKQNLPEQFNPRSPAQVVEYINKENFPIKGRIPVTESKEDREATLLLDEVAGPEDLDTRVETGVPGQFVITKRGRLYDQGVWIAKGLGYGDAMGVPSASSPILRLHPVAAEEPWVNDLLAFRKVDKLLGTYVDKFPRVAVAGRVYGRFNQTGTVTGRLSSSDPNLQNVPARGDFGADIRKLFTGNLVVGDFSQLEPRLMAHFSGDAALIDVFQQGRDIYQEIAGVVADPTQRFLAKVFVLAMGYGAGAKKLSELLRLNGFNVGAAKAGRMLNDLKGHFHTYFEWREATIKSAQSRGYVKTLDGRMRRIVSVPSYGKWTKGGGFGREDRQAANAVIQGSAADIMTRVLLHTAKMFPELHPVAQVHDELVWEYDPQRPPDIRRVETKVLQIAQRGLRVPLEFEPHFGSSWYEAKAGTAPDPSVESDDDGD